MEAYFLLGLDGTNPPKAIGRVRVQAGAIGGEARTTLTTDISLPLARKPQIAFGNAADSEAVPPTDATGGGGAAATGATAGTPGSFTPGGSIPPADAAALSTSGVVASPSTAWATGESVQTGDGADNYWDGTAWAAGIAP